MMVSFVLSFFPRDVLDEILNLIESVSEDFPSYSYNTFLTSIQGCYAVIRLHHRRLKFGPSILLKYQNENRRWPFSYECRNGVFDSQGLDIESGSGTKLPATVVTSTS